jgi:hypothetical protein
MGKPVGNRDVVRWCLRHAPRRPQGKKAWEIFARCGMDTKTLVVGQDVYMLKPPYPFWFCIDEGEVVKVTPTGVDVQTAGNCCDSTPTTFQSL